MHTRPAGARGSRPYNLKFQNDMTYLVSTQQMQKCGTQLHSLQYRDDKALRVSNWVGTLRSGNIMNDTKLKSRKRSQPEFGTRNVSLPNWFWYGTEFYRSDGCNRMCINNFGWQKLPCCRDMKISHLKMPIFILISR
jgi:hypothetical protein